MKDSVNVMLTLHEASGNFWVTELKYFLSVLFYDEHSFHMFSYNTGNINTEVNILEIYKTLSCSHVHLVAHQLLFQMWMPKSILFSSPFQRS